MKSYTVLRFILFLLLLILTSPCAVLAGSATWNLNPISGDWNTAANWTPATVPNAPDDSATFDVSNTMGISLSSNVEVNGIVFDSGASPFTITSGPNVVTLTISGAGITNQSGVTQNFVTNVGGGEIEFINSASAQSGTLFTNTNNSSFSSVGGTTSFFDTATAGEAAFVNNNNTIFSSAGATKFFDNSSAGNATFTNNGASVNLGAGGFTSFDGNSTAANGTFINNGGAGPSGDQSGATKFFGMATAANGTFVNNPGAISGNIGGTTSFDDSSNAGNATFLNKGGAVSNAPGGYIDFAGTASAGSGTFTNEGGAASGATGGGIVFSFGGNGGEGTFINNGGTASGAFGGRTIFSQDSDAGNSTLIANGGVGPDSGGIISFDTNAVGGTSRIILSDNGRLFIDYHNAPGVTVGSIEGDGLVTLNANELVVGSNGLSTTFAGSIHDTSPGGSLTKIGNGRLILTGNNQYAGKTIIKKGRLVINNREGSGTGNGPVVVENGTLGGRGAIGGSVTVGNGVTGHAALAPGKNVDKPQTLTVRRSLGFGSNGSYHCGLDSNDKAADAVVARGVTIDGASFFLQDIGSSVLTPGLVFVVINNTATTPITGSFVNMPDGSGISAGPNTFQANYEGGDGNDLTLTVL